MINGNNLTIPHAINHFPNDDRLILNNLLLNMNNFTIIIRETITRKTDSINSALMYHFDSI